ncbi:MAG: hypothetical protein V3U75_02520 [Methylococcaceae bacterium]
MKTQFVSKTLSSVFLLLWHVFSGWSVALEFIGDTFFASLVKPVYGDFLSFDFSFVGFYHQSDSYDGKIPEPEIHTCDTDDITNSVNGCTQAGDDVFIFDVANRPSFSAGFTGMIAPSLIFSPDPQFRMTLSGLFRVVDPYLGPAPPWVVRAALEYTF